ncbi:transcription regulator HTH, apses-type DNA-binding domain-containing protein, partial [Phlyctochytrium arcticum]
MAPPPGIRAASYSGVRVYETSCRGLPVMRRVADAYINATQILRAAGLPKPQRTKILERDVTGGVHEKVQGGYAGFQGTWIPLDSARLLARAHGIEQDLETFLAF